MTFDEWFLANAKYMRTGDFEAWLSEAWDEAAKAEREACAQLARKASDNYEGAEIAAAIRSRSSEH